MYDLLTVLWKGVVYPIQQEDTKLRLLTGWPRTAVQGEGRDAAPPLTGLCLLRRWP